MPPRSPIADYLDALSRELRFDPALSRRVRVEIEDHLREAVLAEAAAHPIEAEHHVVRRFGNAREIAARYRTAALHLRARRTGALMLCAIAAIFAAMEGRAAWYGRTAWTISDMLKDVGSTVVAIDHYAFLLAIGSAIVGWLYTRSRPIPAEPSPSAQDRLRFGQRLSGMAAIAAAFAVACETLLTGWRLAEQQSPANAWLPAATIAIEIGIVVASMVYFRNTARRFSF